MEVTAPTIKMKDGWFFASSDFSVKGEKRTLWFSMPEKYAEHFIPNRLDAFLVALLPVAMEHGEDIILEGEVSERLLYSVNSYLIPIISKVNSTFKNVSVTSDRTSYKAIDKKYHAAVTGFSGGIDSFCVIAEHIDLLKTPSHQLTHLIFNNVGAISANVFIEKYNYFKSVALDLELNLIPVDSNLGSVIDSPFGLSHSLRNSACALFLQSLFSHYYYASGIQYCDVRIFNAADIAYLDSVLLNLLSTENLDIVCSGAQYTRVEKTRIVSNFLPSRNFLNVCVAPNRIDNCSVCWKCCRTLLTLELLGKVQEYSHVFDLEKWQRVRSWYISEYLLNPKKNTDPLAREILNLAVEANHQFSVSERVLGQVAARMPQNLWNKLKVET
jgi:hypothetical protein